MNHKTDAAEHSVSTDCYVASAYHAVDQIRTPPCISSVIKCGLDFLKSQNDELIIENSELRERFQRLSDAASLLKIRMKETGLDMDVRVRALWQILDREAE